MPELPEVQTTVNGINTRTKNWIIKDVWTDYRSPSHVGKDNIKNPKFFAKFRKVVVGMKIKSARRRAKNILIDLEPISKSLVSKSGGARSNGKSYTSQTIPQTILIHMKMTGHVMCGEYVFHPKEKVDPWKAKDRDSKNPLNDPFNRFIHFVITLGKESKSYSNHGDRGGHDAHEKHLIMSDMRKFGKITLLPTEETIYGKEKTPELSHLGLEPLDEKFTFDMFDRQLSQRSSAPIKQVLMDQTLIAGIGNIYSDEILWHSDVHPKSIYKKIPLAIKKEMFKNTKKILRRGIDFGGDSMSDYRNIDGLPGRFQGQHKAYRRTGKPCEKRLGEKGGQGGNNGKGRQNNKRSKICQGVIKRLVVGGRSGHFCDEHQRMYN